MRTILKRALWGALLAGGITLLGATAANAAETTTGEDGLLSGTQALLNVSLPITVTDTSISILGDSTASQAAAPAAPAAPAAAPAVAVAPAASTGGQDAVASGTQGLVSVSVPVTVTGNAVSVVGDSSSMDAAPAAAPAASAESAPAQSASAPETSGADGILSGTQALLGLSVPITVTGNAISVAGDSESMGAAAPAAAPAAADPGDPTTAGEDSILGGTQVVAPIAAPVGVTGNAISVLGDSRSEGATAPAAVSATGTGSPSTDGEDAILGGTQVVAPVTAPITAVGNAISVVGDSDSEGTTAPAATPAAAGEPTTTGNDGLLGGTQLVAPIAAPITIGGNAISVIGDSETEGPTVPTVPVDPTDPTDPGTPEEPTTPTTPGGAGDGASSAGMMLADAALAETGGADYLPALLAALAIILAGIGAVVAGRRRGIV